MKAESFEVRGQARLLEVLRDDLRSGSEAGLDPRAPVEPALRIDNTDANTDAPQNDAWLITPSVSVFFSNTVALRLAFDYYTYAVANQRFSAEQFIMQWQANF